MDLAPLFEPDGIAVVGASATEGKLGYEVMRTVSGFDGPVVPVNPNAEGEVFGRAFVPGVGDIEEPVDLALLCVPAPVVPGVVAECGEAGVGAAVVYAGGFAEAGEAGRTLQADLVDAAAAHDVAVLGPNTSGFFLPHRPLSTSFVSSADVVGPGSLAVVAQSGGIAHSVAFQGVNEGWGFSGVVGLGNRAVVGFEPVVEYFEADPATDAIVLHVEGTEDARGLFEACAAAETPVAAFPVGERDVADFAASHTAAMTGEHALYRAGFGQYGVPVVSGTTELLDAGHALANAPAPDGPNVGVVTAQAGPGIVVADRLQAHGCVLPDLAPETREAVAEHLPGITYAENPVDTGRPMPGFADLVGAVAGDPNVDAVLVYMVYEEAVGFPPIDIAEVPAETGTPVVFATDGPDEHAAADLAAMEELGVPAVRTPDRAADAVGALVRHAELHRDDRPGCDRAPRGEARPTDALCAARAAGHARLTEAEAKRLLAGAGVDVPEFREATTAGEAVAAADELGYPVVVKVASRAVDHKSEWGDGAGVALGLETADAVREAAGRVLAEAEAAGIEAGLLVEAAADVDAGTEVIVGGAREPAFGPTVLAGLGGVFAEALEDASHRLAPLDRREARRMLDELRGAPLLAGARGRPGADLDALADVVVAVGDVLDRHDDVAEVDLNPVLATDEGATALDALVVLDGGTVNGKSPRDREPP